MGDWASAAAVTYGNAEQASEIVMREPVRLISEKAAAAGEWPGAGQNRA